MTLRRTESLNTSPTFIAMLEDLVKIVMIVHSVALFSIRPSTAVRASREQPTPRAGGAPRALNNVVIVGGGIAGLATAYELSRRGVPFVLLERGARAGGVVLSEQVDDFTIDAGPDSLLVQKPDGIRLCEELGLGERLVPTKPPRLAFILRAGTLASASGSLGARHPHSRGTVRAHAAVLARRASCAWARSSSSRDAGETER